MHTELPLPSSAAREHSTRLVERLRERIAAAGGWLSFHDYMQAALYEPGLGYYSAGATKFGAAGDFVTAPELSPLFSRCLARQCAEILATGGDVLELGGGSGRMAADMLAELSRLGVLPDRYLILEPSADLRDRQAETLAALPHALRQRVHWLDAPPAKPLRGVIIGNEVADALPVQRFVIEDGKVGEVGVVCTGSGLALAARPASPAFAAAVRARVAGTGVVDAGLYVSELCPTLAPWVASLAAALEQGVILLLDYGFPRAEYYRPERTEGTLRCYYRHRAHDDALLWPGLQDITAWVDFTALAEAALAAGLEVAGYTTQAAFLLAAGINALAGETLPADPADQAVLARGLRQLLLPGEMGETVKAIVLSRNAPAPSGFTAKDMRSLL